MRRLIATLLWLAAAPVAAQTPLAIDSDAPAAVAVTIYRAPDRAVTDAIDRDWARGYALVSERRTLMLPAGPAVVRFQGVAGGILPESAIVSGLPDGVREKNLDADLLSPRTLFAGSFGRPVTIRRHIGKQIKEEAGILRSGPDGAAVVQTARGFEAVDCYGGNDAIGYHEVPPTLPATPTLSVLIDSPAARTVSVTLSYLAWGFDWQANYVATVRGDGAHADLLGWVTLANSDVTGFRDAETMVVAGKIKREDRAPFAWERGNVTPLILQCLSEPEAEAMPPAPPPPPPPPPAAPRVSQRVEMDIVVTGARMAVQEDLGDLKLYRVPQPTTVAAHAQKQVALLARAAVPVELLYRVQMREGDPGPVRTVLRAHNRQDAGLGMPLPAGAVAVFASRAGGGGTALLVGEGAIADKAVGEDVEIDVADATQVTVEARTPARGKRWQDHALIVRNASPQPIRFEADLRAVPASIRKTSVTPVRRDGRLRLPVIVPANGTATLRYREIETD